MKEFKDDRNSMENFIIGIIVVLLMMLAAPVWPADRNGDSDSDGDEDLIGDTIIGGDSTRAFALGTGSLGAADIGECIATTQFSLLILFKTQGTTLNKWCAALYLDRQGKHREAAQMRCSDPAVNKIYGEQDCEAAMTTGEQEPSEDDDIRYVQQQEEIEYLREDNASITGRLEALTERIEQQPTAVPSQVQTQIKRQESVAEQRRARAKEAYLKALEGSE